MAARARLAFAVLLACVVAACGGPAGPVVPRPVESSTSSRVGQLIDDAVAADTSDTYRALRAVLVTVDGRTVAARYFESTADSTWDIESAGKTIVATLIGIALAEGELNSLDDPLGTLLPDYRRWMSTAQAGVTLRQLLTMTAGLPDDDAFYDRVLDGSPVDWVRLALELEPVGRPGEGFHYSSAGSHLLSAVLAEATGRSTLDYAREKLFDPLGITTRPAAEPASSDPGFKEQYTRARFAWPTDPQGRHVGGGGLKLSAPDLARLGRLWLDRGRWNGRQLVPRGWMAEAQSNLVDTHESFADGYGYQQWTTDADRHSAFAAIGRGGQVVEVVPDLRAVVVVLSETQPWQPTEPGAAEASTYLSLIGNVIVPALGAPPR